MLIILFHLVNHDSWVMYNATLKLLPYAWFGLFFHISILNIGFWFLCFGIMIVSMIVMFFLIFFTFPTTCDTRETKLTQTRKHSFDWSARNDHISFLDLRLRISDLFLGEWITLILLNK